jgi:predicted enzyme related to lactoylglutathione lyase
MNEIKYVHTNIIAEDWRKLSDFYIEVFNCTLLPPERHLSGDWVTELTGIEAVHIDGVHLKLPGAEGVTLEIFQIMPSPNAQLVPVINRKGLGHLAFHVSNVQAVLQKVIENGGAPLGEVIVRKYESMGTLTAVYAKDPEGNFIEIQNWA